MTYHLKATMDGAIISVDGFNSIEEASETYCLERDTRNVGVSKCSQGTVMRDGHVVAHISYNGRIWPVEKPAAGALTPGVYRLTKDLPAVTPDTRLKGDWRAAPVKAGTLFAIREEAVELGVVGVDPPVRVLTLSALSTYAHQEINLKSRMYTAWILAATAGLERVEQPTATQWCMYARDIAYARPMLDKLCAKHGIGPEELEAMCAEIDAEDSAKGNA